MNTIFGLIGFAVVALAVFSIGYYLIHHKAGFINLGRIGSAVILAGGTLLDQLNVLPWGTILSDAQAKLVGFAIALGMAILHVIDTAKAQTPAPAPVPNPPASQPAGQ